MRFIPFPQNLATIEAACKYSRNRVTMLRAFRSITAPRLILPPTHVRPAWHALLPLMQPARQEQEAVPETLIAPAPPAVIFFDFVAPCPPSWTTQIRAFISRGLSWLTHPLIDTGV